MDGRGHPASEAASTWQRRPPEERAPQSGRRPAGAACGRLPQRDCLGGNAEIRPPGAYRMAVCPTRSVPPHDGGCGASPCGGRGRASSRRGGGGGGGQGGTPTTGVGVDHGPVRLTKAPRERGAHTSPASTFQTLPALVASHQAMQRPVGWALAPLRVVAPGVRAKSGRSDVPFQLFF